MVTTIARGEVPLRVVRSVLTLCYFLPQVDLSATHGTILVDQEKTGRTSNTTYSPSVRLSGTSWCVNAALISMKYVSPRNWHGWDKIHVSVADLGYDELEVTDERQSYVIDLSVAAVNDPPTIEVDGFDATLVLDRELNTVTSAFLVPAVEDTITTVVGVRVWDVDIPAEDVDLSVPDGFFGTGNIEGAGDGLGMFALNPKVRLVLSCTYGQILLGGTHAGLVMEEGSFDPPGQATAVVGSLKHINEALSEGIIYKPEENWSGIDVVQVRRDARLVGDDPGNVHVLRSPQGTRVFRVFPALLPVRETNGDAGA